MDDSTTFAIELENPYKGIRSPHKLKGGVSACIRECAEARGKDFGVIAVEGGWNLYICGNGGANPKHAVLFAEQIDKETVFKYMDRFLMYNILTARPLVRTSTWLDKLDGGLDYLKEVIIHVRIGICETLKMKWNPWWVLSNMNGKKCWKKPRLLKRFNHFVNSDEKDENIEYVPLRDQKMPRPWLKKMYVCKKKTNNEKFKISFSYYSAFLFYKLFNYCAN